MTASIDMGRVGVMSVQAGTLPAVQTREAVREIENLGYGALWLPEGGFLKEIFSNAAILLAATQSLPVISAIANPWAREPSTMASGSKTLAEAFPMRFVLGLGVGHREEVEGQRGRKYEGPVAFMQDYLDAMEAAPYHGPEPEAPVPRIIAAFGPRMLRFAADRSLGTNPSFVPVDHTRYAREVIGPDPLVCPGIPLVLTEDRQTALTVGRGYTRAYLRWENYRENLRRLGWSDADLRDGGSDRLVEAIVAWGTPDRIRARAEEHFEAGANHVCIRPLPALAPEFPLETFRVLAPALLE